jgi:2-iminoacetate synthase
MQSTTKNIGCDIKTILAGKALDIDTGLWRKKLNDITPGDVERALAETSDTYSFEKLLALISPAAENYLEEMAQQAHQLTIQRFGRTIRLYAPLYLSNYCINKCLYCGFNQENAFERTRLTTRQVVKEAEIITSEGFRDILLVSSEDRKFINIDYLAELAEKLRDKFSSISIEIYQLSRDEYKQLFDAGIEGVTLYQETYDRRIYEYYHREGPKSDYDRRLTAPDDIASAGMREIGLGVLLGLARRPDSRQETRGQVDWRTETLALAEHAHYLVKRYWQSHISFSFPRLRPAFGTRPKTQDPRLRTQIWSLESDVWSLSDKNLVQMITALRLLFPDAGLVLSTRERAQLRDHLIKLGITKISAGSKTNPGGYSKYNAPLSSVEDRKGGEQFEVSDNRSPAQIAEMIKQNGLEPVWKDWDRAFVGN